MLIEPNSIINGDCLDVMKFIPDKSIDSIICDLPYGITACKWDTVIPFEPLWEQYKRIIKPNGAIALFGSQPFTSALVMSNSKWFKYEWIWHKSKPSGIAGVNYQPMRNHENIIVFGSSKINYYPEKEAREGFTEKSITRFNSGKNLGSYRNHRNEFQGLGLNQLRKIEDKRYPTTIRKVASVPNRLGTLHPTQKPVALIEYLIKTYTQEGELILDNTAGSGTLAIAAINTDRRYICIEKDEHYFEVMRDRIANHNPNAPVKPKRTKPKPATEGQLKLF